MGSYGDLFNSQGIIGLVLGLLAIGGFIWWRSRKGKRKVKEAGMESTPKKTVTNLVDRADEITLDLEARGVLSAKEGRAIRQNAMAEAGKATILPGKYPAMVFTEEGIKFKKIPERVGNIIQLEPSMPKHGSHYMVVEKEEGRYMAYDPRLAPLLSEETPQRAFNAVNWYREVNSVYANKFGLWDKINALLIGLAIAGFVLVAIIALDKLK